MKEENKMSMLALGDIILGDDSDKYVGALENVLKEADVRIGQLEVPYTERNDVMSGLSREPYRLLPLKGCIDIVSLSGNHLYDAKEDGIEDTIQWLDENDILHAGAGMNLQEARKPVIFKKNGVTFGVLNYNCVGPKATYASSTKAGGAYVKVYTTYDLGDIANPGGPPEHVYTTLDDESLQWMIEDIVTLRKKCDVLIVYFHKGIVHKPIKLAEYEIDISHKAIDAGADVIFSSHSHLLHGIEVYNGKTIYHGLGNGIAWVPSLSPTYIFKNAKKNDVFDPKAWAEQRIERFGFVPDPEYPTYPFHPDAIYTILAKCEIEKGKIVKTGCIPAIVGKDGATRVVKRENGGQDVFDYLEHITKRANLNAVYRWEKDEIIISQE